ncbi:hypothetical protein KL905_004158 [Ogataea polymorpha]|nr:hypothetical protein KL937_003742 [Ogataea polymorpha]KAG7903704.1 hypothetical protein KL907_003731 [Ogataea polymorpha]KAG7915191.1 hypothetical protein KL927_004180 [Ogataea polymorpha]KAG7918079.1 hypothetical protein KL905_004158 [Ogataea polymorpha]KAG7933703.1 hypothetical protein KL904_003963 [Ogataea polymorpha]
MVQITARLESRVVLVVDGVANESQVQLQKAQEPQLYQTRGAGKHQHVRRVVSAHVHHELQLLLVGAHKGYSRQHQRKWRQILKRDDFAGRVAPPVLEQERDLPDARKPAQHQDPAKESVHFGGDLHMLGVLRHGVRGEHESERRHRVAAIIAGQPNSEHSARPEDDAHAGVLVVSVGPGLPGPVFRERVDDSPDGDHEGVVELLRVFLAVAVAQPRHHEHHAEQEPVADEGGAHDPVRVALPRVQAIAEPERRHDGHAAFQEPAQHQQHRKHFVDDVGNFGADKADFVRQERRARGHAAQEKRDTVEEGQKPRCSAACHVLLAAGVRKPQDQGLNRGVHGTQRLDRDACGETAREHKNSANRRNNNEQQYRYQPVEN